MTSILNVGLGNLIQAKTARILSYPGIPEGTELWGKDEICRVMGVFLHDLGEGVSLQIMTEKMEFEELELAEFDDFFEVINHFQLT